jgi:FAD:protein FMN transferase
VSCAAARFPTLGTTATVISTRAVDLDAVVEAAATEIDAIDLACSRFRSDSELAALNSRAGTASRVSPLLLLAIETALRAAAVTDGRVDPTLGVSMRAIGYDRDFRSVPPDGPALHIHVPAGRGWRAIQVDADNRLVEIPAGCELDLGATAKALAADLAARSAADLTGAGVLVSLGGDLAMAGPAPDDGWAVLATDDHDVRHDDDGQVVTVRAGGLATSGTTVRRWRRGGVELHHVLDPRSGRPAPTYWRTATVAAGSCVDANIASTASIVMGADAPTWLEQLGMPSRLVRHDGQIVAVAGWPTDQGDDAGVASGPSVGVTYG